MLSQFEAQGERKYIAIYGVNGRISVAPERSSERILDTPVTIPSEQRTIDATIQAVFAAIKVATGNEIQRGGLIDNETASKEIVVGNQSPVAAKTLLAEALDLATYRRIWVQTWDPDTESYALAIEPATKLVTSLIGQAEEIPVR